jgi:hypothetical protein
MMRLAVATHWKGRERSAADSFPGDLGEPSLNLILDQEQLVGVKCT